MGLLDTLWRPSDTGMYSGVCVCEEWDYFKNVGSAGSVITSQNSIFTVCIFTWQHGIKASQNKVLRYNIPKDSTEGYMGQREPTLHSLAHRTSTYIGNGPRDLNYIWAEEGYTKWACSPVVSMMCVLGMFTLADFFVQGGLISSLFKKMLATLEQSRVLG